MAKNSIPLTGQERTFGQDEIIVSKTDLKGRITYVNKTFMDVAEYTEAELLGQPHSMIRHPDMPRCVFKFMWDTIEAKKEIFAYVINRTKLGNHYWVFAHVTPSFDKNGQINGYHSNRRVPRREVVDNTIIPLYKALCEEEERYPNRKDGMQRSTDMLLGILKEKGVAYDEFVFSL